ncbi:DUF368 domain-containing protein [Alteromonas sediminis]|uniref:DUF368 domain-containing protein n=1 Tax=Alteromonas sediminis TaxID=2259342 RepID=A0A3N5XZI8_9ALTE|nr:DUF368 domain-containing protein [Alteromonas sediminis]RPJ66727.1 DUF368 domain-containing protein [Alteromonas sediminis]
MSDVIKDAPLGVRGSLILMLKGAVMGAADIVPGVSGGTIAFIFGIYERFIQALSRADMKAFSLLKRFDIKGLWRHFDGQFLLPIFLGILISIVTLAKGVSWMLEHQPVLLWSLFNGLIVFSLPFFIKAITWHVKTLLMVPLGIAFALAINLISGNIHDPNLLQVFLAGTIAISALLLPGISGAFILVLLGMYEPVVSALKALDITVLSVFASGCLVGMLTTSKLIALCLSRFHDVLIAFLMGVVIGALYRIWPWKLADSPVSWAAFAANGNDPQYPMSALFFAIGGGLMFLLQQIDKRREAE